MTIFKANDFDAHELITFCEDKASGLRAVIAVHNSVRGPACGGLRMWSYATEDEAVRDVLRLSRGMSYKNALADLPLGGGKAVIWADPLTAKSPELFRAFGRFVDRLGGLYITAEDVGTTPEDLAHVSETTRHVTGLRVGAAASGDPSPYTALGVFLAIKAALEFRHGTASLSGRRVLVQGLGNVGMTLCGHLRAAGASLLISDINRKRVHEAMDRFQGQGVETAGIFEHDCDVYAPCALGATLTEETARQLRMGIVVGAANNQLASDEAGRILFERGILYGPDYVANAGGIINAASEVAGLYSEADVRQKVDGIANLLKQIFARSAAEGLPTNEIADDMARSRLQPFRTAEEKMRGQIDSGSLYS